MTAFTFHGAPRIAHSRAELRRRLDSVLWYRSAYAEERPQDMPATDRAIARLRWALGEAGAEEPNERAPEAVR